MHFLMIRIELQRAGTAPFMTIKISQIKYQLCVFNEDVPLMYNTGKAGWSCCTNLHSIELPFIVTTRLPHEEHFSVCCTGKKRADIKDIQLSEL